MLLMTAIDGGTGGGEELATAPAVDETPTAEAAEAVESKEATAEEEA